MNNDSQLTSYNRMVIVSNRLPVVVTRVDDQLQATSGSGGLVTALAPVIQNHGGMWIGWPGISNEKEEEIVSLISKEQRASGFSLRPVLLTEDDIKLYYNGFSNEIIWPLFHDLQSACCFTPSYWNGTMQVMEKFAKAICKEYRLNDFLWIHDYHLMMLGQELRKQGITSKIAFFLHIPFPSPDIFLKLPWRFQILRGLLEYDLIGFQTTQDHRNFIRCIHKLLPDIVLQQSRGMHVCTINMREVRIGAFPIGIDFHNFSTAALEKEIADEAWFSHEKLSGQKIIFSLDRLDITKGILYRLEAIRDLFQKHPELKGKVVFLQVVIPSRTEIPKYQELKKEIDRLVGEINSTFTQPDWVPIHYIFRSLSRKELLAFYRTSEVALITPVRDGMNLVAKEYIASNVDEKGVLVLSEFAGAAAQLHSEVLLVNPYDIEGCSSAIFKALTMPEEERRNRMKKMRRKVRRHDIFWWVRYFLQTALDKELHDLPVIDEYVPKETL